VSPVGDPDRRADGTRGEDGSGGTAGPSPSPGASPDQRDEGTGGGTAPAPAGSPTAASIRPDGTGVERVRSARYHGGLVAVLVVGAAGVLTGNDGFLLLALVPLAYVAYGTAGTARADVAIDRSFEPERPEPGERVRVRLAVENVGDRTLPDVRVVDGVPEGLAVDGTPATATALRPGETTVIEYAVRPGYDSYRFDPVAVRSRNPAGTDVATVELAPATDALDPAAAVEEVPLRDRATPHAGRRPADAAGSGVEFYATREYRHGDPRNRIDWRRLARTGELTTVEFREERATTTVFVVDAREAARGGAGVDALTLSAYAAVRGLRTLRREGASAGALALDGGIDPLVDPGRGPLEVDLFDRLDVGGDRGPDAGTATDGGRPGPAAAGAGGETGHDPSPGSDDGPLAGRDRAMEAGAERGRRLAAHLPPRAQVVFCTPLLDDEPVAVVRALATLGVPVTLLSPDVIDRDSHGGRAAGAARRARVGEIRAAGALLIDWDPDTRLSVALGRLIEEGRS